MQRLILLLMNTKLPIAIILIITILLTGYVIRTDLISAQNAIHTTEISITDVDLSGISLTSVTLTFDLAINNTQPRTLHDVEATYQLLINNNTITTCAIAPIDLAPTTLTATTTQITIHYKDLTNAGKNILREFVEDFTNSSRTDLQITLSGTVTLRALNGILPVTTSFLATYSL